MSCKKTVYLLFFFFLSTTLFSKTLFTYYENRESNQSLESYGFKLLQLSLEKTKEKYGNFELVRSPPMNKKRIILTLQSNGLENLVVKISTTKELMKEFAYINFPIDRGIVGYRVAFVAPKTKIKAYDNLEKLKKLKIVQSRGWLDTDILRYHGFEVYTTNSKESAFNMLSLGRVALFLRGINEIQKEYKSFKHIEKLDFDNTFVLYYPLPRFFFMHKSNQKSMKRISEGLFLAYEDGSLDRLFNDYHKENIDFLDMKKRKMYTLENPFLKDMDTSYKKYIYNPLK